MIRTRRGTAGARLAIAGHNLLLIDTWDDQGAAVEYQVPALASTEYEPMKWDYFVNHYNNETRQEQDTKFTWKMPSGDLYVDASPLPNPSPPPASCIHVQILWADAAHTTLLSSSIRIKATGYTSKVLPAMTHGIRIICGHILSVSRRVNIFPTG